MTTPVQIPDAAVRAALDEYYPAFIPSDSAHDDMRCALTAALPHLQLGFEVKQLEWAQIHACNGILSAKTHFGTYFISSNKTVRLGLTTLSCPFQLLDEAKSFAQADFERRVRECHIPRPDIKTIIDEIRAGTRQGFLNEGDQPELSDAELSCPYCSGSGHIDDVATNPVDVAAVYREALNRISKFDRSHGSWETIAYDAINIAGRALSAEPAQGEQWQRADSDMSVLFYTLRQDGWSKGQPSMVNDIQIRVSLNIGSKLDLSKVADTIFAALPAAPTSEANK